MQRPTLSILIPALGLAVAVSCASNSPPAAGLAPWDQARVTEIGRQLSAAADAWQLAVRQERMTTGSDRAAPRRARASSRRLAWSASRRAPSRGT